MDDEAYSYWLSVERAIYSTRPLLQIISIKIIAPEDKDKNTLNDPLELYGHIFVEDDDGHYNLYEREEHECETVHLGTVLPLIDQNCVIPASVGMYFRVELNAENASDSELYMNKRLVVDIEDDHERLLSLKLNGNGYDVVLEYFVLECAFAGVVKVELENEGSSTVELNGGKVLALYDDTCKLKEKEFEYPEIVLHNSINQQLKPQSKSLLELDRSYLALPSYSSLIIKVELHEGREESQTFRPKHVFENYYFFGDISLKVTVDWIGLMQQNICTRQRPLKEDRLLCDFDREDEEAEDFHIVVGNPGFIRCDCSLMTEVFSIFIGRECNQDVELYGNIKVSTNDFEWYLFNKDENTAEVLLAAEKMLRIEGPPEPFIDVPLYFEVDLKDKRSSLSIKGQNSWYEFANEAYGNQLLNRRLLDVYRGNYGYAAVHYMMISRAFSASVEVEAVGQHSMDVTRHVRGSIYA